jgi:hypothetical protein
MIYNYGLHITIPSNFFVQLRHETIDTHVHMQDPYNISK